MKKVLDFKPETSVHCHPMVTKTKKPNKIQIRPTEDDFTIIRAGMRKHGLDMSQIIRMALRRFAESEGIHLKAS